MVDLESSEYALGWHRTVGWENRGGWLNNRSTACRRERERIHLPAGVVSRWCLAFCLRQDWLVESVPLARRQYRSAAPNGSGVRRATVGIWLFYLCLRLTPYTYLQLYRGGKCSPGASRYNNWRI